MRLLAVIAAVCAAVALSGCGKGEYVAQADLAHSANAVCTQARHERGPITPKLRALLQANASTTGVRAVLAALAEREAVGARMRANRRYPGHARALFDRWYAAQQTVESGLRALGIHECKPQILVIK